MQATVQFRDETEYAAQYPVLCSDLVTTHCRNPVEFIDKLLDVNDDVYSSNVIFRGQNLSHWPIVATLFRPGFIARQAIDTTLDDPSSVHARGRHYDLYSAWEHNIVHGFANDCMDEGIPLPHIPYNETLKLDAEAASAYFVARNYSIPNRLLDFSKSPVIAAWFAADGVKYIVSTDTPKDIVVWAIRRDFLNSFGCETVSTSWANAQIPQMQRQRAVLIVDKMIKQNFIATGKFQPLEYMMEEYARTHEGIMQLSPPMQRVTLPQSQCLELTQKLYDYELSEVHLFPTLDRIARSTLSSYRQHAKITTLWNKAGRRADDTT